jgi:muramoyltetrapeptide carboxypeptidase LdcA involved in peptidoglycan recycling
MPYRLCRLSGQNGVRSMNYLVGTGDERLLDFDVALRAPNVRAFCDEGRHHTADRVDFDAARKNPEWWRSDITILHLALWKQGIGGAIHGSLKGDDRGGLSSDESLCSETS